MEDPPPREANDPSFTIVGSRQRAKKVLVTRYLVQWAGYSMDGCSWGREENAKGAKNLDGRRP